MSDQTIPNPITDALIAAARRLRAETTRLTFGLPVTHVYNPLVYAWAPYEAYLRKFSGTSKRVVFLGMNPGPFGMVQTGVPFGEVAAVRDWLKIQCAVGTPTPEHPRRPVSSPGSPSAHPFLPLPCPRFPLPHPLRPLRNPPRPL